MSEHCNRLVIYHAGCADGFCAAWLFWKEYPDAEFIPANYGDESPDVTGRIVYVVDFSYPRDVLLRMYEQAELLVVLDHHKTAKADLDGLPFCTFDMDKSGGRLAWEYLYDHVEGYWSPYALRQVPPWIVSYTEDRDLWRWAMEDSRAVNAALRSYPMTFESWDEITSYADATERLKLGGEAILRDQQITVAAKVYQAHEVRVESEPDFPRWMVCNATTLVSETAGELAKATGVGCCWFEMADGSRVYSLRAVADSNVDVSVIAKRFGGGGHAKAAGFKLPDGTTHPWKMNINVEGKK